MKPSPYVVRSLARMMLPPNARVLDMPVGYGRHAMLLATMGYDVTGIDIDPKRVASAAAACAAATPERQVSWLVADGMEPLSLQPASFDLVLVVHFLADGLVEAMRPLIKPGGFLLLESFRGHGGNWEALPQPGAMRERLSGFEVIDYHETAVGPTRSEAVAVRFTARLPFAA